MKILVLDTTRQIARLCVYNSDSEEKEYHIAVNENIKHSEGLFLYLEKILFESKLNIRDFDYFSAVVGPGSFTGIRVGMSVIKGFNMVENKEIVPINSFELLKNEVRNGTILLNSTSTACYYGKIKNRQIIESGVIDKSEFGGLSAEERVCVLKEEQNIVNYEYNNIVVIDDIASRYIPTIIEKIDGGTIDIFEPYYIQLSQAERNLKNE